MQGQMSWWRSNLEARQTLDVINTPKYVKNFFLFLKNFFLFLKNTLFGSKYRCENTCRPFLEERTF